jgi:hypothetical protein
MNAHAALFRLEKDNARVPGPVPGVELGSMVSVD